jgi:hypothetical protein
LNSFEISLPEDMDKSSVEGSGQITCHGGAIGTGRGFKNQGFKNRYFAISQKRPRN